MYTDIHIHLNTHRHMFTETHIYEHTHEHAYTYEHTHTYLYTYTHTNADVPRHTHTNVDSHKYIHTITHTHTHTYAHTHTRQLDSNSGICGPQFSYITWTVNPVVANGRMLIQQNGICISLNSSQQVKINYWPGDMLLNVRIPSMSAFWCLIIFNEFPTRLIKSNINFWGMVGERDIGPGNLGFCRKHDLACQRLQLLCRAWHAVTYSQHIGYVIFQLYLVLC